MKTDHENARLITVTEIVGLIKTLMDYLGGKRAKFWLKAFKRFLRKENPWIPFQKVIEVGSGEHTGLTIKPHLERLQKLGIDVFEGGLSELEKSARYGADWGERYSFEEPINIFPLPQHSVVAVRVEDLLSVEERLNFTYHQILDKASNEYGLDWCSIAQGLDAWEVIIKSKKNEDPQDRNLSCFICTRPFHTPKSAQLRVPMVFVSGKENVPSFACMHTTNINTPTSAVTDLTKPNTILLFRSIPY